MDTKTLNKFSRIIYIKLCEYNPQLISQAEEKSEPNGNFYLHIHSPIKEEDIRLGIYTDADPEVEGEEASGEVTWEFDYAHSHSFGRKAHDAFEWLKYELDALFEGRKFVGSKVTDGKWEGSTVVCRKELDEILAGKFDYDEKIEPMVKKISNYNNMPDSRKNLIIKALKNSARINRIVGWNNIYTIPN